MAEEMEASGSVSLKQLLEGGGGGGGGGECTSPDSGIDLSKFNIVDFVLEKEMGVVGGEFLLLDLPQTSPQGGGGEDECVMVWENKAQPHPPRMNKPWAEEEDLNVPSSVGSVRSVALRTLSKQELQRRKALEDSRRENELERQRGKNVQQSNPVDLPPFPGAPECTALPKTVLQVETRLENPTKYHLQQCVRNNIARYAAGESACPTTGGSVPLVGGAGAPSHTNLSPHLSHLTFLGGRGVGGAVGSAPPTIFRNSSGANPLSPLGALGDSGVPPSPGPTISSVATSVTSGCSDNFEPFSLDINHDINTISLSEINEIISGDGEGLFSMYEQSAGAPPIGDEEYKSSAPLDSPRTPDDPVRAVKDRQKKDNHNKIERRRRFHINDMITFLGNLLPKQNEPHYEKFGDIKQNKGAILQASVDYMKILKDENEALEQREVKGQLKLQHAELEGKKHLLRIQELEELCRRAGVSLSPESLRWKPQPDRLNSLINDPIHIKEEPGVDQPPFCEQMEEEDVRALVTGPCDPMLAQTDPDDLVHFPHSMEFT